MLRRGAEVWIDFEPVRGLESNKRRRASPSLLAVNAHNRNDSAIR